MKILCQIPHQENKKIYWCKSYQTMVTFYLLKYLLANIVDRRLPRSMLNLFLCVTLICIKCIKNGEENITYATKSTFFNLLKRKKY